MKFIKDKYREARDLEYNGSYKGAILAYNELIKLEPNNSKFIHGKGKVLFKLGEYEKALIAFNKAITINKLSSVFYGSRGVLHYKMKNLKNSERDLRYSIYLSKGLMPYHYTLGKIYYESDRLQIAVNYLIKAKHKKENNGVHKLLALCYLKLENYTQALHELIYAEAENSNDHWIQFSIGRCYYIYATKEMGFAIKDAIKEQVENKFKGFKPVPQATEYYIEAKKYLTKSIEINPTYAYGYWMRGECNYCLGLMEESAGDYSNAIKFKPDQIEFYEGWELAKSELE